MTTRMPHFYHAALEAERRGDATKPADHGLTTWDWTYTPDANDVSAGNTSFAAFVVTVALPGVPLELDVVRLS